MSSVDSFITALSDITVKNIIGDIFEQRLTGILLEIDSPKKRKPGTAWAN